MPRLLLAHEVNTNAAMATTRREIITFFINKTDFGSAKITMFFDNFIEITFYKRLLSVFQYNGALVLVIFAHEPTDFDGFRCQ